MFSTKDIHSAFDAQVEKFDFKADMEWIAGVRWGMRRRWSSVVKASDIAHNSVLAPFVAMTLLRS